MKTKLKYLLILATLLVPSAQAEVLYRKLTLMSATSQNASTNGSVVTFSENGMPSKLTGASCRVVASNVSGTTPTADIVVQTCTDTTATNCDTICTFPRCLSSAKACWTDGTATIDLGQQNVYPYFRAVTTLGGTTPVYNVTVEIRY